MTHPQPAEENFRLAYAAAYDDVLRFIQRRVDPSHAEDITADVFLVAWRRVDELPSVVDEQRAWLFGVARKVLANSLRADRRREGLRVRIAQHRGDDVGGGDSTSGAAVGHVDVVQAWHKLSAAQQETLSLATWEGLTSVQAARVLRVSPTAYRIRLSRARRALRGHLDVAGTPHTSSVFIANEGISS